MKAKVRVEQHHIDAARQSPTGNKGRRSLSCPVARACQETFNYPLISVCPGAVWWEAQDGEHLIKAATLSGEVNRFISAFDNNEPVKPFEFKIDVKDGTE